MKKNTLLTLGLICIGIALIAALAVAIVNTDARPISDTSLTYPYPNPYPYPYPWPATDTPEPSPTATYPPTPTGTRVGRPTVAIPKLTPQPWPWVRPDPWPTRIIIPTSIWNKR